MGKYFLIGLLSFFLPLCSFAQLENTRKNEKRQTLSPILKDSTRIDGFGALRREHDKPSRVPAQDTVMFQRVPPPSGMHPSTKACVQDAQGYMWLGTYQGPLRRYDGYNYKLYWNDPQNENSLAANWVEALCAGRNGYIWIGTWGYGLDRLDPATGHFTHYRFKPKDSNSLSNDFVYTILEDREGMIWIGTLNGLNRYDPKTGKFQRYYHQPGDPNSLSYNKVMKIYEDRQGTLWIGTGTNVINEGANTLKDNITEKDKGGLNRFDKKTGKFIRYLHEPGNSRSLINNTVRAIFEDSRGTFWVGTAGDGLHTMDRANGMFVRHTYDPAHSEKLSRPAQKNPRPWADDCITFIIEDSAGAIWIGTLGNGLNRYDPRTNKVTYYPLFKDPVTGMQLEICWWACASRDGMLWIGFFRGLYRLDPLRKNIPHFATGTYIEAICEDRFGALWYGTDQGLVQKDRHNGKEQKFVHDPRNPNTISNNRISAIYEDREGVLWIGTGIGVYRFDRKTSAFVRHHFNESIDSVLSKDGIGSIYEDRQGIFWFGTEKVLIRMDRQTNAITNYRHDPNDSNTISKGQSRRIYEDRSGNIWIATFGGTLNRLSPQTGKVRRFLKDVNVHNLWQDTEGILWVGTSTGLYRSNPALSDFSRFGGPNGEFSGNMIVNAVLEDDQKNLWISASAGICRINPQRNNVLIFSRQNDPTWYNGTGSYKGKNGELFFGGGSGYFIFSPEEIKGNVMPPNVVLSALRITDKPVVPGGESPLKEPLWQTKEIRLRHNQNVFSFDFAGIHFSNPEQNQHLFMLEGLENVWRKASGEKTAYYYNVPPGHYTFRVKAANSDGVWAEKSIAVIVAPPWWRTWWAYAGCALILAAGVGAFVRYRSRSLRHQLEQREKEKQLAELQLKSAELQQQATELEMQALRAQMNPHFIFNCLNAINHFILKNETETASDYLTKFSRLIRLVLQNSAKKNIPLADELETLRLYIDLERVRFKKHFDYSIQCNESLNTES
ncbi:MAG: histidine kinase, partial [Flavisolibacter sp.]|nr:histidine kinase [Flavisolibacter sp.]